MEGNVQHHPPTTPTQAILLEKLSVIQCAPSQYNSSLDISHLGHDLWIHLKPCSGIPNEDTYIGLDHFLILAKYYHYLESKKVKAIKSHLKAW